MTPTSIPAWRKTVAAVVLVAAGVGGGAALANQGIASAADSTPSATSTATVDPSAAGTPERVAPTGDPSQPQRSDERLLTGDDATKATAAALAKYPGATIERVETDSDGVYEAHVVTADGQRMIVAMDASFTVTS